MGKDARNIPGYYGSGLLITHAIKKYGKYNFKKEIIEYCETSKQLNEREIYWIKTMKSQDRSIGYNITAGGDGFDSEHASITQKLLWSKLSPKEKYEKIKLIWKDKTPEERSIASKKGQKTLGAKQRSEIASKRQANKSLEHKSEHAKKCFSKYTADKRSINASLSWKRLTSEERSERAKLIWKNISPEERTLIAKGRTRKDISKKIKTPISSERKSQLARQAVLCRYKKQTHEQIAESTAHMREFLKKSREIKMIERDEKLKNVSVLQIDKYGNVIRKWKDLFEIKESYPRSFMGIKNVCEGKRNRANIIELRKMYIWKFETKQQLNG